MNHKLKWPRRAAQAASVVLVACLLGLLVWRLLNQNRSEIKVGHHAPAFTLRRIGTSGSIKLSALRGEPVIVNFWASWCEPCGKEAPLLEAVWQRYRNQGLTVVGIDYQDFTSDGLAFARKFGVTFPLVRYTNDVAARYGLSGVPETYVVDRRGRIYGDPFVGGLTAKDERPRFDSTIRRLMGDPDWTGWTSYGPRNPQ